MPIYKYMGVDAAKSYLENQTIRFCTPDKYNDPFELKAQFLSKRPIARSSRDIKYELWGNSDLVDKYVIDNSENYPYPLESSVYSDICQKIGMACFNEADEEVPVSHLMWAHYAESHKGMAIKLKENASVKSMLSTMNYRDSQPILDADMLYDENFHISSLYFKHSSWKDENELRLAIGLDQCEPVTPSILVHNFPAEDIEAIFLGANASEDLLKLGLAFYTKFNVPVIKQKALNRGFGFRACSAFGMTNEECTALDKHYRISKT